MSNYTELLQRIEQEPSTWLVTGVAGFIGSNLLQTLLSHGQRVVGLDNFLTGYQHNLDMVRELVTPEQWERFRFIEGDIRDVETCLQACQGVEHVLHEAALGSVPRSIENPIMTNGCNIDGFLNMLVAARDCGVKSFVYAASSSTYGDEPNLPKQEDRIGKPLSPYAVTKYVNELYAEVFARSYGFKTIGLRYFNVFGQRQDPYGAYAAVIPQWFAALTKGDTVYVNGTAKRPAISAISTMWCRRTCWHPMLRKTPETSSTMWPSASGPRSTSFSGLSVTRSSATSPKRRKPNRPTVISGRETYAIPWRTSPVRARCWAMSPNTMSVRACALRVTGTTPTCRNRGDTAGQSQIAEMKAKTSLRTKKIVFPAKIC